jgi:hypothetical protein
VTFSKTLSYWLKDGETVTVYGGTVWISIADAPPAVQLAAMSAAAIAKATSSDERMPSPHE